MLKCGYAEENVASAKPSDMEKYYSKEQQAKCGIVAIGIALEKSEPPIFCACDCCHSVFTADIFSDTCPECGKTQITKKFHLSDTDKMAVLSSVRLAVQQEITEYQRIMNETSK